MAGVAVARGRVVVRTGTAQDAGDLDELNGLLGGIHLCDLFLELSEQRIDLGCGGWGYLPYL